MFTIAQAALPSPACPNISLVLAVALPEHSMCKTSASHHTFSLWDNPRIKQLQRIHPPYITTSQDALLFSTTLRSRHGMTSSRWATRFIFSLHFQDSSKPTTQTPASGNRQMGKFRLQEAHLCSGKAWVSKGGETSAKRPECLRPKHVFTLF